MLIAMAMMFLVIIWFVSNVFACYIVVDNGYSFDYFYKIFFKRKNKITIGEILHTLFNFFGILIGCILNIEL